MIDKQTRDAWRGRDAALHDWLKANKRNGYRPEELPAHLLPTITNEQRAECELFDWQNDPPARYFAYTESDKHGLTGSHITGWTGLKLACITQRGYVYRSNMGDRRCNFRAIGSNGLTYSGIAFIDAGDYVRMRAVKG